MALSRFMPYGAPDLLADQDERMAKALAGSMAMLGALFAVMALIAPHLSRTLEIPLPQPGGYVMQPPPRIAEPYTAAPRPAVVTPASPFAVPRPVVDTQVPPEIAPGVGAVSTTGDPGGAATGGPAGASGMSPGGGEPPPSPTTFVYFEEAPELVQCAPVFYPQLARDAGVEGRVVVRMLVGTDGRVRDAFVDPKHSVPLLDAAALASARTCVFVPALVDKHPVAVWVTRPYEFRLH